MNAKQPICTVISQSFSNGIVSYSAELRICGDEVEATIFTSIELKIGGFITIPLSFTQSFHVTVKPGESGEYHVTFDLSGYTISEDVERVILVLHLDDDRQIEVDCGPAALKGLKAALAAKADNVKGQ